MASNDITLEEELRDCLERYLQLGTVTDERAYFVFRGTGSNRDLLDIVTPYLEAVRPEPPVPPGTPCSSEGFDEYDGACQYLDRVRENAKRMLERALSWDRNMPREKKIEMLHVVILLLSSSLFPKTVTDFILLAVVHWLNI